jgi:hypothetical protein
VNPDDGRVLPPTLGLYACGRQNRPTQHVFMKCRGCGCRFFVWLALFNLWRSQGRAGDIRCGDCRLKS